MVISPNALYCYHITYSCDCTIGSIGVLYSFTEQLWLYTAFLFQRTAVAAPQGWVRCYHFRTAVPVHLGALCSSQLANNSGSPLYHGVNSSVLSKLTAVAPTAVLFTERRNNETRHTKCDVLLTSSSNLKKWLCHRALCIGHFPVHNSACICAALPP